VSTDSSELLLISGLHLTPQFITKMRCCSLDNHRLQLTQRSCYPTKLM